MALDFDVKTFCQNLKATKPPYECPVNGCGKIYKSYNGIQFHLYQFDHDNPENSPGKLSNSSKKGTRNRSAVQKTPGRRSPSPAPFLRSPAKEPLTYAEAQRLVEIELDGRIQRINIYEPLEIIPQDEIDNCHNIEKEQRPQKVVAEPVAKSEEEEEEEAKEAVVEDIDIPKKDEDSSPSPPEESEKCEEETDTAEDETPKDVPSKVTTKELPERAAKETPQKLAKESQQKAGKDTPGKPKKVKESTAVKAAPPPSPARLPEASFKIIEDYVKPPQAPDRPKSYYRFIEKTADEMDEQIEYDMDEEVRDGGLEFSKMLKVLTSS